MDITCSLVPSTYWDWCKLSQLTTSFKGALISPPALYEYIPYAWALSSIFLLQTCLIFITHREAGVHVKLSRAICIQQRCSFSYCWWIPARTEGRAELAVSAVWSIPGMYHAISLTLLNQNWTTKPYAVLKVVSFWQYTIVKYENSDDEVCFLKLTCFRVTLMNTACTQNYLQKNRIGLFLFLLFSISIHMHSYTVFNEYDSYQ